MTPRGLTYLVPAVAPRAWGRTVARVFPACVRARSYVWRASYSPLCSQRAAQ